MRLKLIYCLMLIPVIGMAQWDQNGDNISTGNLRIGSSTNDNISELTILGPNQPLGIGSARDITFHFSSAGKSIIRAYRGGSWDTYIQFLTMPYKGGDPDVRLHIAGNGRVGIGTTSPDEKLTVKGKIHTQEVKVDLNGAVAPDYVFKKEYVLMSLEAVKKYIANMGHLPNMPSAQEMDENGINLKEMNLKLLEKIEELTLYLLEEHSSNLKLRARIERLEANQ